MGRRRGMPVVVAVCAIAVLPGCSANASAPRSGSAPRPSSASTVAGSRPVPPNASQDTLAPGTGCDRTALAADKALGSRVAAGFALAGFPASAGLLKHFLGGTGTEVDYRTGSSMSEQARASKAFVTVNDDVQDMVLAQLRSGRTRVLLSAARLPTVAFESTSSDLYWGFRGTQGLTVTGSVRREHGRFAGTLTYVIRDSYGFPPGDTLGGFGAPMRYLQTACGAPRHAGGAHWFPDTITVTVPFSRPALPAAGLIFDKRDSEQGGRADIPVLGVFARSPVDSLLLATDSILSRNSPVDMDKRSALKHIAVYCAL